MIFDVAEKGSLEAVAKTIIVASSKAPIVLFKGDLGVGKTTLIKEIGRLLGIENQMNSPSFGIVNAYQGQADVQFYHIDLYRLHNEAEAWDIGLMEILDSGSICWVEWPEVLDKVWQSYDVLMVDINTDKQGTRHIFVQQ